MSHCLYETATLSERHWSVFIIISPIIINYSEDIAVWYHQLFIYSVRFVIIITYMYIHVK